jgi:hypothetical protein
MLEASIDMTCMMSRSRSGRFSELADSFFVGTDLITRSPVNYPHFGPSTTSTIAQHDTAHCVAVICVCAVF